MSYTVEGLMARVCTLPPRSAREERAKYIDEIRAYAAALAAQPNIPPGFVLAPTEPSEAMQQAGHEAMFADSDLKRKDGMLIARKGYRAMIRAAAPSPEPAQTIAPVPQGT